MSGGWRRQAHRLPLLGWLTLVWVLLWGQLSVLIVSSGVAVAAAAMCAARLPLVMVVCRVRPWPLAVAAAVLLWDLVTGGLIVSWHAVRHGRRTPAALIEVSVQEESDVLFVLTSNLVALTPGSITVEIDRPRGLLFVHGLPIADMRRAERQRRAVVRTEERVIRAVGSPRDLQALRDRARARRRPRSGDPDREEG